MSRLKDTPIVQPTGGYWYCVSHEQIEECKKVPIIERLRWLEEAAEFVYRSLPPEKWELLQRFRRGEI